MTMFQKIFLGIVLLGLFGTRAEAATKPKISDISIEGTVVALPGTARPLSLYMNAVRAQTAIPQNLRVDIAASNIPALALGDRISATGRLYANRVEPTFVAKQISFEHHDDVPLPTNIEKLPPGAPSGILVSATGTVSSKYAHGFLLARDNSQLMVRVGLPLNVTSSFSIGTALAVTGILIATTDGRRLLVRSEDDILEKPPDTPRETNSPPRQSITAKPLWETPIPWLMISSAGIALGAVYYILRRRRRSNRADLPFEIMDDDDF